MKRTRKTRTPKRSSRWLAKGRLLVQEFRSGMLLFSSYIAVIVNSALLAFTYIIGIGFTAVLARIVGKRFLRHREEEKFLLEEHRNA